MTLGCCVPDYYSYAPLVRLDRALIVLALPGTELTAIVKMLGSFSGVVPVLTDRSLSHELGYLPDKLTAEGRHDERWSLERRLLQRALGEGYPVVAFSSYSAVHADALPWLAKRGTTIYLREDRDVIVNRVTEAVAQDHKRHWLLAQGEPVVPAKVNRLLDAHDAVLRRCERTLDAPGLESHAIAYGLLEPLGLEPTS